MVGLAVTIQPPATNTHRSSAPPVASGMVNIQLNALGNQLEQNLLKLSSLKLEVSNLEMANERGARRDQEMDSGES